MKQTVENCFASETICAYIDRHLDPADEQRFEETMLCDESLADQVQAEMALRRGYAELARREQNSAPRLGGHASGAHAPHAMRATRSRSRWIPLAAAAALFAFAAVPTYMLVLNRQDQAALEARLSARVDSSGEHAAYQLPARLVSGMPVTTESPAASNGPVRIRLPESVREVSLELPSADASAPTRLVMAHADAPDLQFTLDGHPVADAGAIGFSMSSEQLLPGKYRVTVQRQQGQAWVADREFTLNIDGAQR